LYSGRESCGFIFFRDEGNLKHTIRDILFCRNKGDGFAATSWRNIIPVEVGIGRKGKNQIKRAIKKIQIQIWDSDFKCNRENKKGRGCDLYSLTTFSFFNNFQIITNFENYRYKKSISPNFPKR